MTKTEIVFQLFAIFNVNDEEVAELPSHDAITKEVAAFVAGKTPRGKVDDLAAMLDSLVGFVGEDVAKGRVATRVSFDNLTRAEAADVDYVKTFGKDVVLSWLASRDVSHPKRISATKLNDLVSADKVGSFDDAPLHEQNADRVVETEAAEKTAANDAAIASGKAVASASTSAPKSRALTIAEPIAIHVAFDGKKTTGIMNVDATITFDAAQENGNDDVAGKTFKNPSAAAAAAMAKRANGWLQVLFMDADGKAMPVDALRIEPKGYGAPKTGGRKTREPMSAESLASEIVKLEARVRRYDEQLTKAKTKLADAQADLAKTNAAPVVVVPGSIVVETPTTTDSPDARKTELAGMKKKQLGSIAKALNVKGRSSMKADALIEAILAAENVAVAA